MRGLVTIVKADSHFSKHRNRHTWLLSGHPIDSTCPSVAQLEYLQSRAL